LGEYLGTSTVARLFSLNAEPPWQVRLEGDGQLERLAAAELEADQLQLVNVSSGSILFRDGPGMDEMTVDLRSEPPDYAVRIDTQCEVRRAQAGLDLSHPASSLIRSAIDRCRSISPERPNNGWIGAIEDPGPANRQTPAAGCGRGGGRRDLASHAARANRCAFRGARFAIGRIRGEALVAAGRGSRRGQPGGHGHDPSPDARRCSSPSRTSGPSRRNRWPPDVRAPREPSTATIRRRTAAFPSGIRPKPSPRDGLGLVVRSGDPPLSGREDAARGGVPGRGSAPHRWY
jgi:hypothetical protein